MESVSRQGGRDNLGSEREITDVDQPVLGEATKKWFHQEGRNWSKTKQNDNQ